MKCTICDKTAKYKVCFGQTMARASAFGHDRPFPQNTRGRCEEHKNNPVGQLGRPWGWYRL